MVKNHPVEVLALSCGCVYTYFNLIMTKKNNIIKIYLIKKRIKEIVYIISIADVSVYTYRI